MEHKIRKCTLEDLHSLKEFSSRTYDETFRHMNTAENMKAYLNVAFDVNKLREELLNDATSFYFLYVNNELAGYIKLNDYYAQTDVNDPQSLELERIYVSGEFQGLGLGGILLSKVIDEAKNLGKKYVWLGVWEKNTKAIEFYKKHSFYLTGKHPFIMGDDEQTDFIMRRDLNSNTTITVERSENGQITIRNGNSVSAISPMIATSTKKNDSHFTEWAEGCAKLINPNSHTINETEQYFLSLCDTTPLEQGHIQLQSFKNNLILNNFKGKLIHKPPEFSFDMTDKEIKEWYLEDNAMREEARNSAPERFNLIIRGFYLPHTQRNQEFYEHTKIRYERLWTQHKKEISDSFPQPKPFETKDLNIYFFFEETMEQFQFSGGGEDLYKQLVLFKGVTQIDLDKRSPQFLWYISVLRDMDRLSGM